VSYQYAFANTYTNGAQAIYELKKALTNNGWTVERSSDGTTYNSSGDQITGAGSGANGMNNNFAWYVVSRTFGDGFKRSYCFQRSNTDVRNWRITYQRDGNLDQSGSATQAPASDSFGGYSKLFGGGTEASPTFTRLFSTFASSDYMRIIVDNAAPYGWFLTVDGVSPRAFLALDPMVPESCTSSDKYVHHFCSDSVLYPGRYFTLSRYLGADEGPRIWDGGGSATFLNVAALNYAGYNAIDGLKIVDPQAGFSSSSIPLYPVIYNGPQYEATNVGHFGVSAMLKWYGGLFSDTYCSVDAQWDHRIFGNLALPNNGSGGGGYNQANILGFFNGSSTGSGDTTPPVISGVTPTPGTALGRSESVALHVADNTGLFRRIILAVRYAGLGRIEVVHDGDAFSPAFDAHSTRVASGGGFDYSFVPNTGWPDVPILTPYAIDQSGNEAA
jgi:hypothetical protein